MKRTIVFASCLAIAACDEDATTPALQSAVDTARAEMPTFLSFHTKVIARSCSPNPGVCHQSNNYPDLRTPAAMLGAVGLPCNLEIPDPLRGWDSCEAAPDMLETEELTSDIAWRKKVGTGWLLGLRDPSPVTATVTPAILDHAGTELLYAEAELGVRARLTAGSKEVTVLALELGEEGFGEYLDAIMSTVVGGDPNQNGVWGFGERGLGHGAVIEAGSLEKSYLWGRLTGTVPGTRMPLANQPLSDAEYIALACWIESLDPENASVEDAIDYDACDFAASPIPYATAPGSAAE